MEVQAIVSTKGRVTLPTAMRAKLGISTGTRVFLELRDHELVVRVEPQMNDYYGTLKKFKLDPADLEIDKEPDRKFD